MKFYIDKGSEIFLFQLLKASGMLQDYSEVRDAIEGERVTINDKVSINQREVLGHGDIIKCGEKTIEIVARGETGRGKKLSESQPESQPENKFESKPEREERAPIIEHGRVNKWAAKPLNLEKRVEAKIDDVIIKLHNLLIKKEQTLALAESCTGGMLAEKIVNNPGCSKYFLGGVVAYSDQIKNRALSVSEATLRSFGAVSEQVALEMAQGLFNHFAANISVAITGIAGPEGGTEDKPVGTVYTAILINGELYHNRYNFSGTRSVIRKKCCLEVLNTIYNHS